MVEPLYRDKILEHYHHPKNFGLKDGFDIEAKGNNPLCGDRLTIRLKTENGIITDVCFDGDGCAVSVASASIFLENIKRKLVESVKKMGDGEIIGMLGVEISPARIKCATLALDTIKKSI